MGHVLLPSYSPVNYKPGYSGSRDRAEQLQLSELAKPVCVTCWDGPRCKLSRLTNTGLKVLDGSMCASSTRMEHSAIQVTVSSVHMYSDDNLSSAHSDVPSATNLSTQTSVI